MSILSRPAVAERRPYNLWHYVYKLLRLRLTIFWSGLRRASTRRKVTMAILGVVIVALAVFLFWISTVVLNLLQSPRVVQLIDLRQVIASMPSTMISLAFVLFLLSNFGVLLQVLYLANDMDFLIAAPLPIRAVFLAKLFQGLLPNFALISLFALPLMFGLGVMQNYNVLYYPLVVITLATISLLGAGIASLLVMAIVRVVPARRVAEILGFFGAIISLLFSQSGQLISRSGQVSRELSGAISQIIQVDQPWSPLAWAGRGLVALGENNFLVGVPLILVSLGLAGGLFWGALALAERLYFSGWARMQESPRKKKARQPVAAAAAAPVAAQAGRGAFSFIPAPVRAVVSKDWKLLRRDLRNLSQLIAPLILSGIYAVSSIRGFRSIREVPGDALATILSHSMVFLSLGLPMFFGWTFILNLTINAFSREGKNYWMLKTAPLTPLRLMLAKFIASYLPAVFFQWVLFGLVLALNWPGLQISLYAFLAAALYIAGLVGLNLAFGAAGARLDWEDPRRMNRGSTGCLGSLAGLAYVVFAWGLFFVPPALVGYFQGPDWLGQGIGLALGGGFSLAFAFLAPRFALPKVEKIGMQ